MSFSNLFSISQLKLERIFLGQKHDFDFLISRNQLGIVLEAIEKQEPASVKHINYVTLIQDIGSAFIPEIKKLIARQKISSAAIRRMQYSNSVYINSVYLEVLQTGGKSLDLYESKLQLTYFLKAFLETFSTIYNSDILENQHGFMQLLSKQEEILKAEQKQFMTGLNIISDVLAEVKSPDKSESEPPSDNRSVFFKSHMNRKQIKALRSALRDFKYTSAPAKIIEFLEGKNHDIQIHKDKLPHVSYLLFSLYTNNPKLISLTFGKGFFNHFEQHIVSFSEISGGKKLKDIKKVVTRTNYEKTEVIEEVLRILSTMNSK
jgi:hypothetical protein